jgi:hypothetical protein
VSEILLQLIKNNHNLLHKLDLEIAAANEKLNLDVMYALQVLTSSIDVIKVSMCTALNCNLWTRKPNYEIPTNQISLCQSLNPNCQHFEPAVRPDIWSPLLGHKVVVKDAKAEPHHVVTSRHLHLLLRLARHEEVRKKASKP